MRDILKELITTRRGWIPIAIFVIVILAILIPRIGMPYMFDDTSPLTNVEKATSIPMNNIWLDSPDKYRYIPLDPCLQVALLKLSPDSPIIPATTQAIIGGLLAVVIYLLVLKLTRNKLAGLGSALLCVFSLAYIQISWITIQTNPLVELLIVLGLYGYICYRDTGQHKWLYLLIGCAFIAPLVRELAVILPIVVLLTTIAERRWDKKILILLPLLLLHNIFPSTLPNLFMGRLVAVPVFARGLPEAYSIFSLSSLRAISFDMPVHLILFIPPILTLLAVVSIIQYLASKDKTLRTAMAVGLVLVIAFASIFFTNIRHGDTATTLSALPAILCLTVAIVSYKYNKFLSIWFLVAWIPFFRLYNAANAILVAPAIPWTIIIAIWISKLPIIEQLSKKGKASFLSLRPRYMIQYALVLLLLAMGFVSQPLNLITTHKIFSETISTSKEVASYIVANVQEDDIFISNSTHARDLKYYVGNDYKFELYRVNRDITNEYNIPNSVAFDKFVKEHSSQDVYLLVILSRTGGEKSWLINNPNNPVELQVKFQVICRYPTLDPLKGFLPELYRPRGGLPDAAREARISAGLFWQETFIEQGLYKLIREKDK